MFSRNATVSVRSSASTGTPANAEGSTWLPSATKRMIAAAVAQLVIRWLLAILTALLLASPTTGLSRLVHVSATKHK